MKNLITILALTISTFTFASDKPDFTCVEKNSGFTYQFFMSKYSEIHQYDEKGEFIAMYDGIQIDYVSIETFPSIDQYTFKYADGGNIIAVLEFFQNDNVGEGEMIDHDQKMVCLR